MRKPKLLRMAIFCFVIAVVGISLMGCGGLKGKAAYLDARIISNDTVEEIIAYRATLSTSDEQVALTKKLDVPIKATEKALDAWGVAIASGDVKDEEARWRDMLNALIDIAKEFMSDKPATNKTGD